MKISRIFICIVILLILVVSGVLVLSKKQQKSSLEAQEERSLLIYLKDSYCGILDGEPGTLLFLKKNSLYEDIKKLDDFVLSTCYALEVTELAMEQGVSPVSTSNEFIARSMSRLPLVKKEAERLVEEYHKMEK